MWASIATTHIATHVPITALKMSLVLATEGESHQTETYTPSVPILGEFFW